MERRTFLATALAAPLRAAPSDRVNVAVVGVRGRGRDHIREYGTRADSRVAAICDIDDGVAASAAELAAKTQGSAAPKIYKDIRALLENKDVDAISIATCNHWHALAAIWACQAGKDVYVEKPACHNIWEGRRMVEAARKYGRVVQCGMQARSIAHYREAIGLLHAGAIGKLYMAKSLCYKRRRSIGRMPNGPVPPGVDYNLWLGPAPERAFNPNRFHYNWHWFWDTGNGDIGNQGVHEIDLARWGLGKTQLPAKVHSTGGKFVYDDDQETPNTQIATFEYGDAWIVSEVRGILTGSEASIGDDGNGNYIGNIFFGDGGYLSLDSGGFQLYLGEKRELALQRKHVEPVEWDNQPHIGNFLDAVRSRKADALNCEILEGTRSAALVHLANASYRTGRALAVDHETEGVAGDVEANRYLRRDYRPPFVVPERV